MTKTIVLTGATDGIGLATAQQLAKQGHDLLIHGRNSEKLARVAAELTLLGAANVTTCVADLSSLTQVVDLAKQLIASGKKIDVLINNAGVFKTASPRTSDNMDVRFVVNTLAPYLFTRLLEESFSEQSRVINLSSAAQASVDLAALRGGVELADMAAYAQSKLAITMWTQAVAQQVDSPLLIAVNPGSLLASKMVKQGFGVAGNDISIGADILIELALGDEACAHHGQYFDNDAGHYAAAQVDGNDANKQQALMTVMHELLAPYL